MLGPRFLGADPALELYDEPGPLSASPADLRPDTARTPRTALRASRREGGDLGEARGLQFRACVRRQQIRKMEYLVPDILAKKCDTLVSIGGVQSNHTRQVAAVAAKLGLKCHLVQGSWVNWPDGLYDRVGNIQLSRVLGAEIMFSREDFSIAIKDSWQRAIEAVERAGGRPYAIRPVHRITHSAASATHALPTSLGRRSAISVPGSITLSSRQLRPALRRAWWSGSGRRVDRPR